MIQESNGDPMNDSIPNSATTAENTSASVPVSESGAKEQVTEQTPERASNGRIIGVVLALTAVITLMLLSFLAPVMNSGPKDLPFAVAGPEAAVKPMLEGLGQKQPGAFDVTTYESPDAAKQAIQNREAIGGMAVEKDGLHVFTAAGAGTPYKQMLTQMAQGMEKSGQHVTIEELAPTTADDPNASGISVLAMPLAFGGMASAAMLTFGLKGRRWGKIVGSLAFSTVAGFVAAAIMQFGFGNIDGNYFELAAVLGLGIAGTSMFVLGLESLLGAPGLGVGALVTIFISNPLSGIGTGWQWLPSPWGHIGQFLPIGAAGNAVRSVAYFNGAGITHSVIVLLAWMLVGCLFVALSSARSRKRAK